MVRIREACIRAFQAELLADRQVLISHTAISNLITTTSNEHIPSNDCIRLLAMDKSRYSFRASYCGNNVAVDRIFRVVALGMACHMYIDIEDVSTFVKEAKGKFRTTNLYDSAKKFFEHDLSTGACISDHTFTAKVYNVKYNDRGAIRSFMLTSS